MARDGPGQYSLSFSPFDVAVNPTVDASPACALDRGRWDLGSNHF